MNIFNDPDNFHNADAIIKRSVALLLAALLIVCMLPVQCFAATGRQERPLQFEENIAAELKKLNLFKGVSDTDFALEKVPSRIEALVIMLRLMGKENEIISGSFSHPFTDVPDWADNYVGYAYKNKLTKGISASTFGTESATDVQFLTFVLRALGYSDSEGDFAWDNPYDLSKQLGLLNCSVSTGSDFLRADCANIAFNALGVKLKNSEATLASKLILENVFSAADYKAAKKAVPNYGDVLKAFELDTIKWNYYPVTEQDYYDNFFYSFIRGAWEFDIAKTPESYEWYGNNDNFRLNDAAAVRCDLLGIFMNQRAAAYCLGGKYYVLTYGEEPVFSKAEIINQLFESYSKAKEITDELKQQGIVTEDMPQKQIAEIYSDYLIANDYCGNPPGKPVKIIDSQKYDSAYACLINKFGNCGSRASAYNLLMHLSGIHATGYHVTDHILSYALLDGTYYLVDWGNRFGVFEVEKLAANGFREDGDSGKYCIQFADTRRFGYSEPAKAGSPLPEIKWKLVRVDFVNKYYWIELADPDYNDSEENDYTLIMGEEHNGIIAKCTFDQLKHGFELRIAISDIFKHNIKEDFFLIHR